MCLQTSSFIWKRCDSETPRIDNKNVEEEGEASWIPGLVFATTEQHWVCCVWSTQSGFAIFWFHNASPFSFSDKQNFQTKKFFGPLCGCFLRHTWVFLIAKKCCDFFSSKGITEASPSEPACPFTKFSAMLEQDPCFDLQAKYWSYWSGVAPLKAPKDPGYSQFNTTALSTGFCRADGHTKTKSRNLGPQRKSSTKFDRKVNGVPQYSTNRSLYRSDRKAQYSGMGGFAHWYNIATGNENCARRFWVDPILRAVIPAMPPLISVQSTWFVLWHKGSKSSSRHCRCVAAALRWPE